MVYDKLSLSQLVDYFVVYGECSSYCIFRWFLGDMWNAQLVKRSFPFDAADGAGWSCTIVIIFMDCIVQVFSFGVAVKTSFSFALADRNDHRNFLDFEFEMSLACQKAKQWHSVGNEIAPRVRRREAICSFFFMDDADGSEGKVHLVSFS